MELNQKFWNQKYHNKETPWDIGYVSPPIKSFIDQLDHTNISVLFPGAGRAYEAIYMHQLGFKNVYVCDWAQASFDFIIQNEPSFPIANLICEDFFKLENRFDLIIEQTFFCAIDPKRRKDYVSKVKDLLKKDGRIVGLLFSSPFPVDGPPFGGSSDQYTELFKNSFVIEKMEIAQNSIRPRLGNELFFSMKKK